jgi:hypothetical protein
VNRNHEIGGLFYKEGIFMATIIPKGENIRRALKWISDNQLEDKKKPVSRLIQEAGLKFNLSPNEEAYLEKFYRENKD